MSPAVGALRIGEFARRVGVSPELLRAWERRYSLLQPVRSTGGCRPFSGRGAPRGGGGVLAGASLSGPPAGRGPRNRPRAAGGPRRRWTARGDLGAPRRRDSRLRR